MAAHVSVYTLARVVDSVCPTCHRVLNSGQVMIAVTDVSGTFILGEKESVTCCGQTDQLAKLFPLKDKRQAELMAIALQIKIDRDGIGSVPLIVATFPYQSVQGDH
ncbi:MAG: hypothetical protein UU08_C0006G0032 [Candidatus Uhrbacteria bacterium GW2011_GWE2_40_58]|nr:MAG: hypothetical protein UT94_C0007G0017 [Candidatus Uhrbacteria bacterium GW2011_GWF2_40_263]KKR67914.1 MAG: hypothetical protein UU08_C0006G0032 [Candidatus Uhrbacteria bacterium GW2011_GWE2_40_58]OGL92513.1 MAG: hypothetical protein A2239_01730 [Candidatus Uhrbacteria bacterium RIFOXYA2_FULL_40_9]OGL96883.1 MAG: hypothetical protein A2332_02065 [Candidatus Uhrbacteria bacterium RIFOXYB2_FULL_41_18]HBK34522.1 hypothetical protein [Candidatus Uhrbacteria bacterium]